MSYQVKGMPTLKTNTSYFYTNSTPRFTFSVKLHLRPENTDKDGYQVLVSGEGKDEKDKKGAFKALGAALGLKPSSTSDEKKLRETAHNGSCSCVMFHSCRSMRSQNLLLHSRNEEI